MKKAISFVFLLTMIALIFPTIASAHTKLTSSSPKQDEAVNTPIDQIQLEFNTMIEPLSSFKLTGDAGTIDIKDLRIDGQTMTGSLSDGLKNGTYEVQWKIVGKDGHPIKGAYSFSVSVPAEDSTDNQELQPQENPSSQTTREAIEDKGANDQGNLPVQEQAAASAPKTGLIYAAIAGIAVILTLIVMRRRRS
ncbi:copper resistance CopC family protein [Paenibacillus barengoltzii]|uniref:Copper resistance protein CopC n=1 Tax=Paenibacillus timonensis TaxID=225915 RepID=A0ABW3S9H9_9BACL|nr:copper resistance CopC family protein [Paenibacillus timonensis]MCH1638864.1 copper resistance protein CopC [Paenibacillus timonensis]